LTVARITVANFPSRSCWDGVAHATGDGLAIADQEERQVQGDEEAGDEVETVLADAQGVGGDQLAALRQRSGQPALQRGEVAQAKTIEQRQHPLRQCIEHLAEVQCHIPFAGLDVAVDRRRLAGQRGGDQCKGNDHDEQHDQQGQECCQRAALACPRQQPAVHRGKQQGNDGAPQDGPEKWPQDPRQCKRDRSQQQQERLVLRARERILVGRLH